MGIALEVPLQRVELRFPEFPRLLDPPRRFIERRRAKAEAMDAAVDLPLDQSRLLEHTKVLRDSRRRHVMRLRKLSNRRLTLSSELRQDPAPRRVGERMKDAVEMQRTINHLVNDSGGEIGSQEYCSGVHRATTSVTSVSLWFKSIVDFPRARLRYHLALAPGL